MQSIGEDKKTSSYVGYDVVFLPPPFNFQIFSLSQVNEIDYPTVLLILPQVSRFVKPFGQEGIFFKVSVAPCLSRAKPSLSCRGNLRLHLHPIPNQVGDETNY